MQIRVGLTTNDLTKLVHRSASVSSSDGLTISFNQDFSQPIKSAPGTALVVTSVNGSIHVSGAATQAGAANKALFVRSNGSAQLSVDSLSRAHGAKSPAPHYIGNIEFKPVGNALRMILTTSLENYIKGVLQSEIPASYHPEAIKAQAVAARTYALRPRIDHTNDFCNVCDSFLCCQYFAGVQTISERHAQAISDTAGQILTYEEKPILALFSSNAGGCTEDYENCFSDPLTGEFPPQVLPYLKSASEKDFAPNKKNVTEEDLRTIWNTPDYSSADSWSPHFRWHVLMPASKLEAHMHHEIEIMRKDPTMTPFIVPPKSGTFGHINSFMVPKRGRSGSAIELSIETSAGNWLIKKELVIRSVFKNSELKLARLKSAKLFFDLKKDDNGLLSLVTVHGLGWGHGVGMQQTGAQGWAKQGKTYKQILGHYFSDTSISQV